MTVTLSDESAAEILRPQEWLTQFDRVNVAGKPASAIDVEFNLIYSLASTAPMVRYSKLPFRQLMSLYDAHIIHTPMILVSYPPCWHCIEIKYRMKDRHKSSLALKRLVILTSPQIQESEVLSSWKIRGRETLYWNGIPVLRSGTSLCQRGRGRYE